MLKDSKKWCIGCIACIKGITGDTNDTGCVMLEGQFHPNSGILFRSVECVGQAERYVFIVPIVSQLNSLLKQRVHGHNPLDAVAIHVHLKAIRSN